jgi:hypothetical protein
MFVCFPQRKNKLNGKDKVMCTIETKFSKKIEHKIIGDLSICSEPFVWQFSNHPKKGKKKIKKKIHYLKSEFFLSLFTKKSIYQKTI